MEQMSFGDGNIYTLQESRYRNVQKDTTSRLQMHSSLVRRLSLERELEGHQGCVNTVAWNSRGSLLISGSDDSQVNIWSYHSKKLLHSIDTGHSANIFCTKFVPETSDELVVSGAGDAEVRLFNLSRLNNRHHDDSAIVPSALFQCHTRRVKKLAVEIGNPNVVWSASEDGTLRQHDFRETTSCRSSHQECRNILLDLRSGAKRSLADPPKHNLSLKSCDISSAKPHLLLVGGSDAFARLYDRRMLPPLTSCRKRTPPPPCVDYFCPMHLSTRMSLTLQLTHVTFSPNGEEVLLSYSGEHVYLMDVNHGGGSSMQYSSEDVAKLSDSSHVLHDLKAQSHVSQNGLRRKMNTNMLAKCRKLVDIAKRSLEYGSDIYHAIEACNQVLDGYSSDIGSGLRHECLCIRAALLLKRKWKHDVHMAIRDCISARGIDSSSYRAHLSMSEAMQQLGKQKEALDFAMVAQSLATSNREVAEKVESIKKDLEAADADTTANGEATSDPQTTKKRPLSNIVNRSEVSSEGRSGSDGEDSDYEAELELQLEASVSGDEDEVSGDEDEVSGDEDEVSGDEDEVSGDEDGVQLDIFNENLNIRIQRSDSSAIESGGSGSPSSSSQNNRTSYQCGSVIDMKQRYVGHCNIGTDIKQASFLGQRGEYVASGSDDGRWFIWEKKTGRLIKMLLGDEAVVNCIQSHPFDCAVATSGIDNTIKIWTPTAPVPSHVAGGAAGPETEDVMEAIESNARKLCVSRVPSLPFDFLEGFRMHEFREGALHPYECTQT